MTIQQLRYFLALCQDLNYSHTAARLYLSRQALRQSISALEQELCGALFANDRNHLSLTEKGESLRNLAAPVVAQFDVMCTQAYRTLVTHPPVHLGISKALIPDYLPSLGDYLTQFRQSYPGISLELSAMENDAVPEELASGRLDAGLVMDTGKTAPGLTRTPITEHNFALLIARNSPFWKRQSIAPQELSELSILVPSLSDWFLDPLRKVFAAAGSTVSFQLGVSFYQVVYAAREYGAVGITRAEHTHISETDSLRELPLTGAPRLYTAFLTKTGSEDHCLNLLKRDLHQKLKQNM